MFESKRPTQNLAEPAFIFPVTLWIFMKVVVVESPSKAKTINKYLGPGYEVLASFGHIRDLPAKDGSVDPDNNFKMLWEVDPQSQKRVNDIAHALKKADTLILATDPDREGEAISWHVLEALNEKKALKGQAVERVVFNAITKQSVTEAMKHPRAIDGALVDAYMARRALDYLVGFTLSPVLWRKLPGARSAGRVQSVALRLVCDRELEIEKFVRQRILVARRQIGDAARRRVSRPAWSAPTERRSSVSTSAPAPRPKTSRRRSRTPTSRFPPSRPSPRAAIRRRPSPPRRCSRKPAASSASRPPTPCGSRSGSTKASISAARPPASSPICEPTACRSPPKRSPQPRKVIGEDYGNAYVPDAPRQYQTKAKNAQEAHEAIRPTDLSRRPAEIATASMPIRPGFMN